MAYDLTDLKVFVAVAEEANLSRGAERCHLAPSSVSLRIKNLEDSLGVVLFSRHARGVALTPAGQVLIEHARRCIAQLDQMQTDLQPFADGMNEHVTVFANNNAISSYLPNDLARFFELHPNVRITLEERLSHDIVAAVLAGRADIGVVALESEHPALDFLPYHQDRLVVLAPPRHPLLASGATAVSFTDCVRFPFISLQSGAALHTFLMNQANAIGQRLDVRVQVSGYRAIVRLISSGAGIGVVPLSVLDKNERKLVAICDILESWSQRDLRVCIRRESPEKSTYRDKLVALLCDTSKH